MALYVHNGSIWSLVTNFYIHNGSGWSEIINAYVHDGSTWKEFHSSAPTLQSATATINTYGVGTNCSTTYHTNQIAWTIAGSTTGYVIDIQYNQNGGGFSSVWPCAGGSVSGISPTSSPYIESVANSTQIGYETQAGVGFTMQYKVWLRLSTDSAYTGQSVTSNTLTVGILDPCTCA